MNLGKDYVVEGQMSIFDCFSPDLWSGKTYRAHSVREPQGEETLGAYLKKFAELRIKPPQYLNLKMGGQQAVASWDRESSDYIAWLGEYTMHSFGEKPSSMYNKELCSKWGPHSAVGESLLSQILEVNAHQKYYLSARACQGILNRARKRGKQLPPLLEETLIIQSQSEPIVGSVKDIDVMISENGIPKPLPSKNEPDAMGGARESSYNMSEQELCQHLITNPSSTTQSSNSVVYGISSFASNSMKSANPNSGIYEADTARTLDNNGGNPTCNQGGMMVVQGADMYNQTLTGDVSMSVTGAATDSHHIPCVVLEGNGSRPSHMGDGYRESDTMYTLNATEHHAVLAEETQGISGQVAETLDANYYKGCGERQGKEREVVCVGNGQLAQARMSDKVGALNCMHDQQMLLVKDLELQGQEPTCITRRNSSVSVYEDGVTPTLEEDAGEDGNNTPMVVDKQECYGIDRAAFNQGENALFSFSVEDQKAQTIVAKGPGGGTDTAGR